MYQVILIKFLSEMYRESKQSKGVLLYHLM